MAAGRFRQPPLWDAIDHCIKALDKTAALEVKYINSYKGRGVFAKALFLKGDFVVEYRGEIISSEESQSRRSIYHHRCTVFMFDFYCRQRAWCIDAAQEDGSFGRLVNDDHYHSNCKLKKIVTEGKPRLFLFALRDISAGEEITYDYGEADYPWRKKAVPQTTAPESSSTTEEAPQRSFHQVKTLTQSSDSEVSVDEEEQDSVSRQKKTKNMPSLRSEIDSDSDDLFELYNSGEDYNQYTSEDDSDVEPPATGSLCKTVSYKPTQHCLFCKLGFVEIALHLLQAHYNEPQVREAFSFPSGSKERRMCLDHLTSRGNFAHSASTASNAGVAITHVQAACASPPPEVKREFGTLFVDTLQDAAYHAVLSDACIMEFGEDFYNRLEFRDNKDAHVRHKMRELGRLLICSRKISPMRTIRDHITPENFMHVVRAVKRLAGFDSETNTYKSPGLAPRIGKSLLNVARLVESRANKQKNHIEAQDALAFRKVYEKRWHELVLAASLKAHSETKDCAPQMLAFTRDVQRLHCYLDVQRRRFLAELHRRRSPRVWSRLTKITLTQVALFNRLRTREVSEMPLSSYVSPEPQGDGDAVLSDTEKKLCQNTRRLEMRGKRGKKIVVLLTPAMQQSLDLLVSNRQACKVNLGNTFLFGRPMALSCYRGSDTLRIHARQCGAENPVSLSCAKLYRQTGAMSLVLNLGHAELIQLADLLGPGVCVHKRFYRLLAGTLQLAKICKVLLDRDRGHLAKFKGKRLEDISIDPDEDVHMGDFVRESHSQGRRSFKTRWQMEEIAAVERHMMPFITSGRVPWKADCESCLKLEAKALGNRSLSAVKHYVSTRILALKKAASRDLKSLQGNNI